MHFASSSDVRARQQPESVVRKLAPVGRDKRGKQQSKMHRSASQM
jgi:hypothetical protein